MSVKIDGVKTMNLFKYPAEEMLQELLQNMCVAEFQNFREKGYKTRTDIELLHSYETSVHRNGPIMAGA